MSLRAWADSFSILVGLVYETNEAENAEKSGSLQKGRDVN